MIATEAPAAPARRSTKPGRRLRHWAIGAVTGVLMLGGLGAICGTQTSPMSGPTPDPTHEQDRETQATRLQVKVAHPTPGGLPRQVVQTGSLEAFESVALYGRVSGSLKSIDVEIGDRVRKDQVLAEIDAPELVKDVERQSALMQQAHSRIAQAEARMATARAERSAREGTVRQAAAEVNRAAAERSFRGKELARIRKLSEQNAVESKLVDEKLHQWEAASPAEEYAQAAAAIAEAELQTVTSRIEQARVDIVAAEADARVATAELARAQVMLAFTEITAPFDGVVTKRNFDRGSFVRAATDGAGEPLLQVARTDHMRVVVRIPDPDVPFVCPGQPASVKIDVLGGRIITGTVSRVARYQDRRTRTMRAEIDLPNADNSLVSGMYGAVSIAVPAPAENLTLPDECLVGPSFNGRGKVYVLCEGRLSLREVGVGRCEAGLVEILSSLSATDRVLAEMPDDADENWDGRFAVVR